MIITSSDQDRFQLAKLIDANGVEITMCTWADTQTGEVIVFDRDEEGSLLLTVDDNGNETIKTKWEQHTPPLTIVPFKRIWTSFNDV